MAKQVNSTLSKQVVDDGTEAIVIVSCCADNRKMEAGGTLD